MAAPCLRARQQQHCCLDTGRRADMPNKHSLITDTYGHTQPCQYPNSSMYSSTLAPSLRCGRSHWLPLVVPCCCSSAPSPAWLCRLCHRTHQGQVPHVPTRTAPGNQQRDLLCATLYTVILLLSQISVQKPQEAPVLGMQHPANCSSPLPLKHQRIYSLWQQRI